MLPRLAAEESIESVNRMAVAMGTLERSDMRAVIARWERAANGGKRPKPSPEQWKQQLAGMGVAVIENE
jgi:hypothetical protein